VALAGRADLPPIPAVDWNGMEIAKNALFEFYLTEQILQRDCSSAVHLSRLWDLLMRRAQNSRHAVLREAEQQEVFMKLGEGLRKRQEMMESSGVFYLCLALWPDPYTLHRRCHTSSSFTIPNSIYRYPGTSARR
jgi:uracil DNA glycosylase